MSIEETARMLEQDAAAIGHQFSDCADVFMRAKQRVEKERDELKYRVGTAEQMTREACCLLRECIPHLTGRPPEYLNNRISVWLASADGAPPPTDHRADAQEEAPDHSKWRDHVRLCSTECKHGRDLMHEGCSECSE